MMLVSSDRVLPDLDDLKTRYIGVLTGINKVQGVTSNDPFRVKIFKVAGRHPSGVWGQADLPQLHDGKSILTFDLKLESGSGKQAD